MIDYGESFCQAVDIIVSKRLSGISFDKTIICTIEDDSRREEGLYIVSNGTLKFEAYSSEKYRIGNNVYVSVPEGDWNQQKFIVGKKTDKDKNVGAYVTPFDTFYEFTGNLIDREISQKGLTANGSLGEYLLWEYFPEKDSEFNMGFTRLGLQGQFMTLLQELAATEGNYGLKLLITADRSELTGEDYPEDHEENQVYEAILDSYDMIGNPYRFNSFYEQEKVFDISGLTHITKLQLYLYQNKNFKDYNKNPIPAEDNFFNELVPNIFVKDCFIALGYDVKDFDRELLKLHSLDKLQYSATVPTERDNYKKIILRWLYKKDNGQIISVDEDTTEIGDFQVHWYRYYLGQQSADDYSGVYWTHLVSWNKNKETGSWVLSNINTDNILVSSSNPFEVTIDPDITFQDERFKVIIIHNGIRKVYSNILVFQNEKEVVNKPTVDAVQALSIVCEDGSYGNYRIYNLGNSLIDGAQATVHRDFKALFNSSLTNTKDGEEGTIEAEEIIWYVPANNSMVVVDSSESSSELDNNRYVIRRIASPDTGRVNCIQPYRIKGYYSQQYSNNTIMCKLIKDKITYTATKELSFGPAGTTGTDCTLIIDFMDGVTACTVGDTKAVQMKALLYDYNNQEIDFSKYPNLTFSWSWKSGGNSVIQILNQNKDTCELKLKSNSVPNNNYQILQVTLQNWGDYTLRAFLPIPIRKNKTYQYISGTTAIMYDTAGYVQDYFRDPYILYKNDTAASEITWALNSTENVAYRPTLITDRQGQYRIQPLGFYVEGTNQNVCIYAIEGEQRVWAQPILIVQNRYPSKMINDWDGSLKVDEGNNAILAARIAAGKKNSDNTFSGVIMGDWGEKTNEESINKTTGLYGFHKGKQSFGFKEDGKAFIGKSGNGRIIFDGDKSTITSNRYAHNGGNYGMELDFDDGRIKAKNGDESHQILIDVTKPGIGLEDWSSDEYDNEYIYNISSMPFQIGTKFGVDWDGTMYASNGRFTGEIEAASIISSEIRGGSIYGAHIFFGTYSRNPGQSSRAWSGELYGDSTSVTFKGNRQLNIIGQKTTNPADPHITLTGTVHATDRLGIGGFPKSEGKQEIFSVYGGSWFKNLAWFTGGAHFVGDIGVSEDRSTGGGIWHGKDYDSKDGYDTNDGYFMNGWGTLFRLKFINGIMVHEEMASSSVRKSWVREKIDDMLTRMTLLENKVEYELAAAKQEALEARREADEWKEAYENAPACDDCCPSCPSCPDDEGGKPKIISSSVAQILEPSPKLYTIDNNLILAMSNTEIPRATCSCNN